MTNKKSDKILWTCTLALVLFGLVMVASAGVSFSKLRFGDEYLLLRRQVFFGLLPGLVIFYLAQRINYRFWKKISTWLFLLSLVFLALVFIEGFGSTLKGASRWLDLGPLSFQPSEFAKLSLIFYLAAWLETKEGQFKNLLETLAPFLVIISVLGFLVIMQPDLGTLGVMAMIALVMYFSAGAPLNQIFGIIIAGLVSFFILAKAAPYRMNRLLSFMNPSLDPQGIGYQVKQALIAIGSGGILGVGLGHSRQKFNYLPEPVGDSIFAIIGEELGIIGTVSVVLLFLAFAMRGFKIAKNAPDFFSRMAAIGITSWIVLQAFINIAAITSLIPLTGVPLPFISYGGTSLVFTMFAAGVLLNISKYSK